ncbi:MAG: hypothetical protein PVH41_05600 [Anaerolineae bacterium]|jgi:hypothetical protein
MVTKRQLGLFIIALSVVGTLSIIAVDALGAGQWSGVGPLQRLGIVGGVLATVVGLVLTRMGNRPA